MRSLAFWKRKPKAAPPVVHQPSDEAHAARWRRLEALAPTIRQASLVERQAFMLELYALMLHRPEEDNR